jgi:MoaA/NifB/PqqE/SkfB family radical SAM enzyme
MSAPPILHSDGPAAHDAATQPGGFASAKNAVRQSGQAAVAVTLQTFSKLPRILDYASALTGHTAPKLDPFNPRNADSQAGSFSGYLNNVRASLTGSPVILAPPDPALMQVLETFDERATPELRPNLLRLLGVLADDVFIGPKTFHLDLSNRCNTNCVFCALHSPLLLPPSTSRRGRRFTEGWRGRMIDEDVFYNLADDLAEMGTREDILFSGEGEPLTHPRAMDFIRYVKGKRQTLTLFTNGLLLDKPMVEEFVKIGLDRLYWSLSASTPESFAKQQPARKPADFTRMVEMVKHLVKKKGEGGKPTIVMAHVIHKENYAECEAFMELAKNIGVDQVRFQVMHSCRGTRELLIEKDQLDQAKAQIDRARISAEKAGIEVIANIDFQLDQAEKTFDLPESVLVCHWSHELYKQTGCLTGWFFARSFTDGRLSFCCHDKIVGNLNRARFKEWWFSEKYAEIRRKAKRFDLEDNIDLTDQCCGSMLLDNECDFCGNYEFINQALSDLRELGWDRLLRRA